MSLSLNPQPHRDGHRDRGERRGADGNRLAILFAAKEFRGDYFTIEGIYGSCYDVHQKGEFRSITLEDMTEHCDVWGVQSCGVDGDGAFLSFLSFPIDRVIFGGSKRWQG